MCATMNLIFQLHECASVYMRVSIAVRGANRKTSRRDFFACFGWPNTVRAKPWGDESVLTVRASCSIYHIAKVDPHGGHLRLEMVSPVPPSAQDISMKSERRSLSYLKGRGFFASLRMTKCSEPFPPVCPLTPSAGHSAAFDFLTFLHLTRPAGFCIMILLHFSSGTEQP